MECYLIFFVLLNAIAVQSRHEPTKINRIINLIQRRLGEDFILSVPESPEELPEAEPMLPGHTLLRPAKGMLKSAVKFPHRDYGNAPVYGNFDNLGITHGKTNGRILYTDFRKANNLLILLEIDPNRPSIRIKKFVKNLIDNKVPDYRRRRSRKKTKFRDRSNLYSGSDSGSSSGSSEDEKNPGNPYTIHKNKYKQNWLWNYFMDGDHVNVNPYAPDTNVLGPSGSELFLGRKWWYFNQDDYKPIG